MPSVHSGGDEILATPQLLAGVPTLNQAPNLSLGDSRQGFHLSHTPDFIVFKYHRSMKSLGGPKMSVHEDQSALPSRSLPMCSLYENMCHMSISHMSIKYIYHRHWPMQKATNWNPVLQSDLALLNILFLKVHLWAQHRQGGQRRTFGNPLQW